MFNKFFNKYIVKEKNLLAIILNTYYCYKVSWNW